MNLRIDITKLLNHLIIPISSLIFIIVMYFIFIGPYLNQRSNFSRDEETLNSKIKILEEKKQILQKARESKEKLTSYRNVLNTLVPKEASASDLVGVLDVLSKSNNFTNVEENKNVISPENARKRIVEIRFNGRTASVATALKFLDDIHKYPSKQFSLNRVEITANPEERFARVSFNSFSTFNSEVATYLPESPVVDILSNKTLMESLDKLIKK